MSRNKYINIALACIGVFFLYSFTKKKTKSMKEFISFQRKWEGGKSKALTDTASSNPAPNSGGIHTNSGITWSTFKSVASKIGLPVSTTAFLNLSDESWFKIMKRFYWDSFKLDELVKTKPSICYIISAWAWGFGNGGAEKYLARFQREHMNINDSDITPYEIMKNFKKSVIPEKILFNQLIEAKRKAFEGLNQPANLRGWIRRLEDFKKTFQP